MSNFYRGETLYADELNNEFSLRVLRSGDTMTGSLLLWRNPQQLMEAATKQYVDSQYLVSISYVPIAGGTMTGPLILNADPIALLGAATKQYVDMRVSLGGGTGGASSLVISDTAPVTPTPGMMWFDSVGVQTYLWYQDPVGPPQWVPLNTPPGLSSTIGASVTASLNNAGRNLIHNSLFNVAQRGIGAFTVAGYTLDRWVSSLSTDTASFSQFVLSDADRAAVGDEAASFALLNTWTGTSGAGALTAMQQRIENLRRLAGKTVTVSFWARSPTAGIKLGVELSQYFGSGGSPSAFAPGTGVPVTLGTSWQRYSVTISVPSISGMTLGTNNDNYTTLAFWYSAGSNFATRAGNIGVQSGTVMVWGVQLEVGPTATPLEKPDPQQDLAKCQRFYQLAFAYGAGVGTVGGLFLTSVYLPVSMRASPTITQTSNSDANLTSPSAGVTSPQSFYAAGTATAAAATTIYRNYTASADL
jgi:hypothetical protein